MQIIQENGHERVILERVEYDDLVDARDHAIALRDIAAGDPSLNESEMDAHLAAPSPLAYWRTRAGKTLAALAVEAGQPQTLLANIEEGKQEPTARVLARIARVLNVRIEDLVPD